MTTVNVDKSTKDRLEKFRRDSRTQEDIINRLMDEITFFESMLPKGTDIGHFIRFVDNVNGMKEKIKEMYYEDFKSRVDRREGLDKRDEMLKSKKVMEDIKRDLDECVGLDSFVQV